MKEADEVLCFARFAGSRGDVHHLRPHRRALLVDAGIETRRRRTSRVPSEGVGAALRRQHLRLHRCIEILGDPVLHLVRAEHSHYSARLSCREHKCSIAESTALAALPALLGSLDAELHRAFVDVGHELIELDHAEQHACRPSSDVHAAVRQHCLLLLLGSHVAHANRSEHLEARLERDGAGHRQSHRRAVSICQSFV